MKKLWTIVNSLNIDADHKNTVYLLVLILVNAALGAALWGLAGRLLFPGIELLICFMSYPGIFLGLFGGILYLFKHEFA